MDTLPVMTEVTHGACTRPARAVSEREIAIALVMEFAENDYGHFSMLGAYDNDAEFIDGVAERLDVKNDKAFTNKMTKVVRVLENYGVLIGRMISTHKEYIGEPTHQKNYWMQPGKVGLIRRGKTEHTFTPLGECEFLLRKAYPKPE